jgi:hypothetical protein
MAFSEATLGGAFDLCYDPTQLEFVSFSFDDFFYNNVSDPAFDHAPDNCFTDGAPFGGCSVGDPELNAIGFGNFDGISGSYLVGTIVFQAVGAGSSDLTMAVNDAPFEGFFSAETGLPMDVLYNSAKVDINPVPVPAAAWLLMTALGLLGAAGSAERETSFGAPMRRIALGALLIAANAALAAGLDPTNAASRARRRPSSSRHSPRSIVPSPRTRSTSPRGGLSLLRCVRARSSSAQFAADAHPPVRCATGCARPR